MRFLVILVALIVGSCGLTYRTVLGIDTTPNWKLANDIDHDFDRWDVPRAQRFTLDTASYQREVIREARAAFAQLPVTVREDSVRKKRHRKVLNDNLQPTQIRYFDAQGQPIFKVVNCYLDGMAGDWNVNGAFDQFPPRTPDSLLEQGNQPLEFFLSHLRSVSGTVPTHDELPVADYYALLFINDYFIRPSRAAVRQVRRLNKGHNVHVLYVHNQNAQIWPLLDEQQRAQLRTELATASD